MREIELAAELLKQTLPHLKKRVRYNPDPELVTLVKLIESYLEVKNENIQ
jgi:hypothetical protein